MNETNSNEISLKQIKGFVREYTAYLYSKKIWIILIAALAGMAGVYYAWTKKPVYKAELTYASAQGGNAGGYSGIAAQFGLQLPGVGTTVFEGDNLMQLLKSRLLIEKTFMTPVLVENRKDLLINYFIKSRKLEKVTLPGPVKITFDENYTPGVRVKDSIFKKFYTEVSNALIVDRPDRKFDFVTISLTDEDEFFAKNFIEQLANNAIQYYVEYKVKKARQDVSILQRQTDSVRRLISGGITSIAVANDLNVNPIRQSQQVGSQRRQVDIKVNAALYEELVKNLELSKMSLRRETPLIQIVDPPMFPLEKQKLGRLKTGLIASFAAAFLVIIFFLIKKLLDL